DVPQQVQDAAPAHDAGRPEEKKRDRRGFVGVPSFLRLPTPWSQKPAAETPRTPAGQNRPQGAAQAPSGSSGPAGTPPSPGGPTRWPGAVRAEGAAASTAGSPAQEAAPGDAPSQAIPAGGPTNSNPFVTGPLELGEDLSDFPYGRVRFELRDHGEGIAPEPMHRIFERFYRLDTSRPAAP